MTQNRRILLNILATYVRSLYSIVVGLFCGRWALMAMGHVDYGLYGVVGGLTAFISFFNGVLAYSIGRFYALSIGRAAVDNVGLEECRKWFSVAVVIHTTIPCGLMFIGYPLGEYLIRYFLTIPEDRIESCIWVFRFMCASCFLSMIAVPYQAMYTAKQHIAELTIYSFVTITLNICFLYYMVSHPGFWLTRYAFWTCILIILPLIIISIRAKFCFPECKFKSKYGFRIAAIRELFSYTGWQAFGALGAMLRGQGIAILVNKYFGPSVNAAMTIGNQVNGHSSSLASSMIGAFMPAITSAYGAGKQDMAIRMALRSCKFAVLLLLIFMIPLSLELPGVLGIWLKNPPEYTTELCFCMMLLLLIDKTTVGHMVIVHATGRIAAYQSLLGGALILTLPLAWILVVCGLGVYSICYAMIFMIMICAWGRVYFTKKYLGMKIREWLGDVMVPLLFLTCISSAVGFLPHFYMRESFMRICVTTFLSECVLWPLAWQIILDKDERTYVKNHIRNKLNFRGAK